MKDLPIGINSLRDIIEWGKIYVDKTEYLLNMIDSGKYYFLSRPRRFGKTLTVDTLKNIFEGRKELFKGLYIYNKWNWEKKYPVIRIDFSGGDFSSREGLINRIFHILKEHQEKFGIENSENGDYATSFYDLVVKTSRKYNQKVAILIDEYDKPILDNILDKELAKKLRDLLSNFYGIMKGLDEYLRFVLLTGVSKFSKVNLFSELNNLEDITVDERYSALCGYTDRELDMYFNEYLKDIDREKIRDWYNGYSWLGEKVYNPFDILLFISKKFSYRPYWFETGTPTFLVELMKEKKYFIPGLEEIEASDELLDSFDVHTMEIESLLWQTGYLTIKGTKNLGYRKIFLMSYPNLEVKQSLNGILLRGIAKIGTAERTKKQSELYTHLLNGEIEEIISNIKSFFSSIPYHTFTKSELYGYEGFYGSVLYAYFSSLGVISVPEDVTNRGRIDLTLLLKDYNSVYIFEFKIKRDKKESGDTALKQIKEKRYYEKYLGKYSDIYLIGLLFDEEKRNLVDFAYEKITSIS